MTTNQPHIAIVGGAVAGLAAAEALHPFAEVALFERQSYDEKPVNCGEAIIDTTLIPLDKESDNGFLNKINEFELQIHRDRNHDPDVSPLTVSAFSCETGYICDRDTVERQWAERLRKAGVNISTGTSITQKEFWELTNTYDYVVDATGQPSLTMKASGQTEAYTGDMIAINADINGDFQSYYKRPRIVFEGYTGYWWSFPKSTTRANVGIGWAGDERPNNYKEAFHSACRRNGIDNPDQFEMNIYTIPQGPSLDPSKAYLPDRGVFLVGDAAGIANRYQGEGICQAIRSSYLLADLLRTEQEREYPHRLYQLMKSEYRLAHLMRGVWEEYHDPELLASVVKCIDGMSIDQVTREPQAVFKRLTRKPAIIARLMCNKNMIERLYNVYTNNWEFANNIDERTVL